METEQQIKKELALFRGTERYYSSSFGYMKLTDGMQYLRGACESFWLIDIVESVQYKQEIKDNCSFIVWKIEVDDDKKFKVSAWSDVPYDSKLLYKQEGDYTNFPLKDFEFWQEGDVLLLPGEH